jgi:phosphate transport system permease protein
VKSSKRYGALALIAGTSSLMVLPMLIGVPFGLGAAIYVSEFCGPRLKEVLKIVALMSVPVVVSISEDALKAVPDPYREAAEALGATLWQVVYTVLLPAARNGLMAAALLGVGRAVGETMAVIMATYHSVVTIVLVSDLVHQARRLGDLTAFLLNGYLIEVESKRSSSPIPLTTG